MKTADELRELMEREILAYFRGKPQMDECLDTDVLVATVGFRLALTLAKAQQNEVGDVFMEDLNRLGAIAAELVGKAGK